MRQQDWIEQLRDRMVGYEADIPAGLWADIERSLSQQRAVARTLWLRRMSAAALVALLAGVGWYLWPPAETEPATKYSAHTIRPAAKPDADPLPLVAQASSAVTAPPAPSVMKKGEVQEEAVTATEVPPTVEAPQDGVAETAAEQAQQPSLAPLHAVTSTRQAREQPNQMPPVGRQQRIGIGLQVNSGLLANRYDKNTPTTSYQMDPSHGAGSNTYSGGPQPSNDTSSDGQDKTVNTAGRTEGEHHSLPFSLGLTVSYPLSTHWALVTGIVYTRLDAEFTNAAGQTNVTAEQTLHYLGIPLNLQYRLLESRHWKVYAMAGTQVDWNLHAKSAVKGVGRPMPRDRAQWSLSGSVGIEYDFMPQLGVYAEPGISYYFDNGSRVQNFFKAHPTSWTFQLGARLNLGK